MNSSLAPRTGSTGLEPAISALTGQYVNHYTTTPNPMKYIGRNAALSRRNLCDLCLLSQQQLLSSSTFIVLLIITIASPSFNPILAFP